MKVQKKKKERERLQFLETTKLEIIQKNIRKHKVIIYRAYKIKNFEVKAQFTNL